MSLHTHILMVEGQDDRHVIQHIVNRHQIELNVSISARNGIEPLLEDIPLITRDPGWMTVGIVIDSDTDISSRWNAVRNRLIDEGFDTPPQPDPDGTIIYETEDRPRIGIWMMPNNRSTGELEDFVARMIPDNDVVWPLSVDYIERIPATSRMFSETKTQRAKVHAWLAAREDPRQMGQAIRARDLEVDGELCEKFVAWLRNLFEL